jgi:hypothetical protein
VVEAAGVGSELENDEELTERKNQIPFGWWFQTFFIFHNIWDNRIILPIDQYFF